jgi:ribose transport system ATP-binding protein
VTEAPAPAVLPQAPGKEIIRVADVAKDFGGVRALRGVTFALNAGEVRALVGANGSGKSTLVKILAGYHEPEPGASLRLHGVPTSFEVTTRARDGLRLGVVHQDLGLIDGLSLLENFLLPTFARRHRWHIDWRRSREMAAEFLSRFGVTDLSATVERTPRVTRALLALARAVYALEGNAEAPEASAVGGVLILDEITAFLSVEEIGILRDVVRDTARRGHAVLFVSHDLSEVMTFADKVTVFRDGLVVGDQAVEETSLDKLFELIVGRKRVATLPLNADTADTAHPMQVIDIGVAGAGTSSFMIAPGEVLGATGLLGSGFEEIPYILFGARTDGVGSLRMSGEVVDLSHHDVVGAIARGIALVPGERLKSGLIGAMSIAENVTMLQLRQFADRGRLAWSNLRTYAGEVIERYRIVAPSPGADVLTLSGGNQQRVLLAKWLETRPRLLLLHEPVQGIDVAARIAVAQLIRGHAKGGAAILCASSDYEFLSEVCDRVLIYGRGEVTSELGRRPGEPLISRDAIEWACLHSSSHDPAPVEADV